MSRSTVRGLAIAGVAALTFAAPASALAASHGHAHQGKASTHHSQKHHGKPAKKKFTAVGVVTAVDATGGTVTLADKGGSKDLHGTSVTVVVGSTTKVTRNDATATLADVQVGDHVMANGVRADGALNARHVNADSAPEPDASESPEPAATESSTDSTTTTDSSTPEPTATDTAAPAPTTGA